MDFDSWIRNLREVLQEQEPALTLCNGHWEVANRKVLWQALGPRIFDAHLDEFKACAVEVLTEIDPQFELPAEERYAASIHGKVLKHSSDLRQGMAETLALLGNYGEALTNCSRDKAESIAALTICDIFEHADWRLWGSLNNLLPTLAEAAPGEFLTLVENALGHEPCPFDELFAQEGCGVFGSNYMTGLLWALESLSWNDAHLVRVAVILAELATHDPGGNWANRPANSLTTILLPWFPQTLAPINKRIACIKAIKKDFPDVAWRLLLSLLPNQHQISSGAHKPRWYIILPEDWKPNVTKKEYWEQVTGYAEIAVDMACEDLNKLKELVSNLDNLPKPSFDAVLKHLSSKLITGLSENEQLPIWTSLTEFSRKHHRFSDAKWALSSEIVSKIEGVAVKLAPTNPLNLHRRLFNVRSFDLYEEKGNWEEQQQKLEERRQQAIKDVLSYGGLDGIIQFAEAVESPSEVGHFLGVIAEAEIDKHILSTLLETDNKQLAQFANGYVWSRQHSNGWEWVDGIDRSSWSVSQVGQFLSYLPFTEEAWNRATAWLEESEGEYWTKTSAHPYYTDGDIGVAIDKLIEYGRPNAAINCLNRMLHDKQPLDKSRSIQALLAAVSSAEPSYEMDAYNIVEIIKALRDAPGTDPDDLFRVEWAYLPLLDRHSGTSPKLLENRLASDPAFFCEVIRLIDRSRKEEKSEKVSSEQATNAWRLLHEWRTPPGMQSDGSFSGDDFRKWLKRTKAVCAESGHLEVALTHIGRVLFYCSPDPQGLWIDQTAADALNRKDTKEMRNGFRLEVFNSRGAYYVDPTGKPERELATQWRQKADDVENAGYQRFAVTLKELSESYNREAERIVDEQKMEDEE